MLVNMQGGKSQGNLVLQFRGKTLLYHDHDHYYYHDEHLFVGDNDYENGDGEDYCLDNVIAALNIKILKCNRVSPQQLVCILKGNGIMICKVFWIISYFFAATFGTKVTLKRQRRLWAPGREAICKKMGIVRKNRKSETRPRGDLEER